MNRLLVILLLLWSGVWLVAQDVPSLTVAPSDQIRYPDSKDILNPVKNPAAPGKVVGPLIASTPVPAKTTSAARVSPAVKPAQRPEHGWFLVWNIKGDEAAADTWWATQRPWVILDEPLRTQTAVGSWEYLWGPLEESLWIDVLGSPPVGSRLVRK